MSAVVLAIRDGKRGRKPIDDERNALRIFPTNVGMGAGLYAIGFKDGRVKFGKARRPRSRVLSYWHQTGGSIAWAHYFGRVTEERGGGGKCPAEELVCQMAASAGQRIGRSEYFTGLTKVEALSLGRAARSHFLLPKAKPAQEAA